MPNAPLSAGIVGFRGYSGAELIRLLAHHPHVAETVLLEHRSDSDERPAPRNHTGPRRAPCTPETVKQLGLNIVFMATPHEVAIDLAPGMLAAGAKVIDLGAAFRLRTPDVYQRWYKDEHHQPALLAEAAYGLPEFYRDQIRPARLIANPGCYPTAANLALAPLLAAGVINLEAGVVCDAKSGVSGAGRKPSLKTSFCETAENFSTYAILQHRHVPEVLQNSGIDEANFSFTAQLLPVTRGILETIYFRGQNITSAADLIAIYETRYAGEPFVRIYDAGKAPDLASVNYTNFCDIGVTYDPASRRAVVVSCIDNLIKGAAGQAVQNMNLISGFDETAGLL